LLVFISVSIGTRNVKKIVKKHGSYSPE